MTNEERIEAAAKADFEFHCVTDGWKNLTEEQKHDRDADILLILRAAVPELFKARLSDPPSHWLAPWDASKEMEMAAHEDDYSRSGGPSFLEMWDAARTAHLRPKD